MPKAKSKKVVARSAREAFRLAVLAQAEELCVPGFATPLWQARYATAARAIAKAGAAQ